MHQGLVASLKSLCIEVSIFEFHILSHDDEKKSFIFDECIFYMVAGMFLFHIKTSFGI